MDPGGCTGWVTRGLIGKAVGGALKGEPGKAGKSPEEDLGTTEMVFFKLPKGH